MMSCLPKAIKKHKNLYSLIAAPPRKKEKRVGQSGVLVSKKVIVHSHHTGHRKNRFRKTIVWQQAQ